MRTLFHKAENVTNFSDEAFHKMPQKVANFLSNKGLGENVLRILDSKVRFSNPRQEKLGRKPNVPIVWNSDDIWPDESYDGGKPDFFIRSNRFTTKEFVDLIEQIISYGHVTTLVDGEVTEIKVSVEVFDTLNGLKHEIVSLV